MKKISAVFLFLFFFYFTSFASFDFNANCKSAYEKIINLRFVEGQALIDAEKKTNEANLIPYYLENYIDFLKIYISEDYDLFNKLKGNEDIRITKIKDSGEESSPYYNYCLADIYLQWAFARCKFYKYIEFANAAGEINKAYSLLEDNKEKHSDFIPNYKGLGLLHTLIGVIPDEYKWTAKIFGITGTISQGVSELSVLLATANKNPDYSYLKTESIFYLTFIQLNLQSNKAQAVKLGKYLSDPANSAMIKDSPLLSYAAASIAMRTGSNDKAVEILLARPKGTEYYPFHYLDYITGVAKLNRLDIDSYTYLTDFITNFKGKNYIKAAYRKLAWYYLINNNTVKYKEKLSYVISAGTTFVDEDKEALAEAKSNIAPNITLLKARLLFDGGYYQKAVDILAEKKPSEYCVTTKDFLEFYYRMGRIYDELDQDTRAVTYYELTIKSGSNLSYYFAASSALNLGLIYENKADKVKAKYYYDLCISMKNTEYKSSLNQKAKAGLSRIE